VARRVKTEDGFGTWSRLDAQELGTDRHAAIGADPDERSGTARSQLELLSFSSDERSRTGGRCPPDPLGFFRFRA
jgi:hypothetical protein